MERELKLTLLTLRRAREPVGCGGSSHRQRSRRRCPAARSTRSPTPRYAVRQLRLQQLVHRDARRGFRDLDESWLNSGTTYPGWSRPCPATSSCRTDRRATGRSPSSTGSSRMSSPASSCRAEISTGRCEPMVMWVTRASPRTRRTSSSSTEDSAWVPRYESNLNPSAPPENQGQRPVRGQPVRHERNRGADRPLVSRHDRDRDDGGRPRRGGCVRAAEPRRPRRVDDRRRARSDQRELRRSGTGMVAIVDLEDESVTAWSCQA